MSPLGAGVVYDELRVLTRLRGGGVRLKGPKLGVRKLGPYPWDWLCDLGPGRQSVEGQRE